MKFALQIDSQVRRMIEERDDGSCAVAAIWRDVGHRARRRKLLQPSYESVRRLVREHRRPRRDGTGRLRQAFARLLELVRRPRRPRTIIVVVITGGEARRLPRAHKRRARDESSRATAPATA